jgi:group I intron endonuclease
MLIYCITNSLNGKRYIGATTGKLSRRKSSHLCDLRHNRHGNPHLQAAFNKYGNVFDFHTLEECETKEILSIRERNLISIQKPEYNLRSGGIERDKHSSQTRKKIGIRSAARWKDELYKQNFLDKRKQRGNIGNTKLTEKQAHYAKFESIGRTSYEIGTELGVSASTIQHIRNNLIWKNLRNTDGH